MTEVVENLLVECETIFKTESVRKREERDVVGVRGDAVLDVAGGMWAIESSLKEENSSERTLHRGWLTFCTLLWTRRGWVSGRQEGMKKRRT